MAQIKVLRVEAPVENIIAGMQSEKIDNKAIRLNLRSPIDCIKLKSSNDEVYELGNIIGNGDNLDRFLLFVKETKESKINIPALRVAIISLFKHLVENDIIPNTLFIPREDFRNSREENSFICTVKEFAMTYFGEVFTEEILLIITD